MADVLRFKGQLKARGVHRDGTPRLVIEIEKKLILEHGFKAEDRVVILKRAK